MYKMFELIRGVLIYKFYIFSFCLYPQELIIHLNEASRVKKLQILSHQFMIGSKVEFFVGMSESPESFRRLG